MAIVPNMSKLSPDTSPKAIWEAVGEALTYWEAAEIKPSRPVPHLNRTT